MLSAVSRLRAAAVTGIAVATLLAVTPVTATATTTGSAPARVSTLLDQAAAYPATAARVPAAARLIADARRHLGARYLYGATGPRAFDCIGLVLRSFAEAGLIGRIGGWSNSSGYALYAWARRHHRTSTTGGRPGDIVVWGGGGHVGIYLGNDRAISALVSGVRIHGIFAVTKRFTAFIHTGLASSSVATTRAEPRAKSIGVRHARTPLIQRAGHATSDRAVQALKAGTRLTLLRIWQDAMGRTWYRVNANRHVGWVLASGTAP